MAVSAINIPKGSQISPATERVYHQTNLIGDWKGTWKNSSSPVEFKVVNIRGSQATAEYTHVGHTERGIGIVSGDAVMFGSKAQFSSKDGTNGTIIFKSGIKTYSVPVTRMKTPAASTTSSNTVNKLA